MSEEIMIAAPPTQTTTIHVNAVAGNLLNVTFEGIPNNLPNTYGNYLVVWRNKNTIPWNDPNADGFSTIAVNKSKGSQSIDLKVQAGVPYVVGYAVGPKGATANELWKNVCATNFIPEVGDPEQPFSPSLTKFQLFPDTITMNYKLPSGATPKTNGAWVGVWQAGDASYTTPPIASAPLGMDSAQGAIAINVSILRDQEYTVALFTSGYKAAGGSVQTAIACTATLTT